MAAPLRNITRIDSHKTHGWYVRASKDGKTHAKLFSDRKCGNKAKALAQAISFRDTLFDRLGIDGQRRRGGRTAPPRNRTTSPRPARETPVNGAPPRGRAPGRPASGPTGVSRIDSKNTHGWFVRVYRNGKTHSKLFSDSKFGGREDGLRAAVEYRRELVERLDNDGSPRPRRGRPPKHLPDPRPRPLIPTETPPGAIERRYVRSRNIWKVVFRLPAAAAPDAQIVHLVGDFNHWNRHSHRMHRDRHGSFHLRVELAAGRAYAFRYLVDGGRWENDWEADAYRPNGFGEDNSVILL